MTISRPTAFVVAGVLSAVDAGTLAFLLHVLDAAVTR